VPSSCVQSILALLIHPAGGNPTQFMLEKAFAHHDLDWRYLTFEVPPGQLEDAVRGMRALGFRGGNIADPHQQAVIPLLDRVTDAASKIGRVNLVVRQGDALVGDNNEGRGFLQSLRRLTDLAGRRAAILVGEKGDSPHLPERPDQPSVGARCFAQMGTVPFFPARAIAVELQAAGAAEIWIVEGGKRRPFSTSADTTTQTEASCPGDDPSPFAASETDILISTAPIGTDPDTSPPMLAERLRPEMIVADLAMNPPTSELLHNAAQQGCKTLDGLDIFISQAALSFREWTGVDPDRTVMREAVEEFLEL
jgi:shikimate dehydrogenase